MNSHLKEVNEKYFEHMFYAQKYGIKMIFAGLACIIHSVVPNLFISTASDTMKSILAEVRTRKEKSRS